MRNFPSMQHMTVKSVREYLKRKQAIIIPVGVIEQHGYHLPLCTDALIAEKLAGLIGAKAETLVAPVMHHSFSGGDCPGTINISPSTMSLVIGDVLISLTAQGFRRFYILLCHGGSENVRALENTLKMLLRTNPAFAGVMIALMPVWKLDVEKKSYLKGFEEGDWHAGWVETSLVMALAPELVALDELETDPEPFMKLMRTHPDNFQQAEKIVDDEFVIPRMFQRKEIEIGVMGYPEKASPEEGMAMVTALVDAADRKIRDLESRDDGVYRQVSFTPEPLILK